MKTIILYALPAGVVPDGSGGGYSAIQPYSRLKGFAADTVFVRAELINGGIEDALSKARPRKGEVVLNTIAHL